MATITNDDFLKIAEKAKNKYGFKPSEFFLYKKGLEDMMNYINNYGNKYVNALSTTLKC